MKKKQQPGGINPSVFAASAAPPLAGLILTGLIVGMLALTVLTLTAAIVFM